MADNTNSNKRGTSYDVPIVLDDDYDDHHDDSESDIFQQKQQSENDADDDDEVQILETYGGFPTSDIVKKLQESHHTNNNNKKRKRNKKTTTKSSTIMKEQEQEEQNQISFSSSLSPIKLFATKQDEILRHQCNSINHWSYHQCWTLREMIGLDHNPYDNHNTYDGSSNTASKKPTTTMIQDKYNNNNDHEHPNNNYKKRQQRIVKNNNNNIKTKRNNNNTTIPTTTINDDDNNTIEFLIISNFMIDFSFLLEEVPELLTSSIIPIIIVIYGVNNNDNDPNIKQCIQFWKDCRCCSSSESSSSSSSILEFIYRNPSELKQSKANPLNVQINWGCHHTKLFLIGYKSGRLRIIIHTANLLYNDIHLKTQGAYIQDFWFKQQQQQQQQISTTTTSTSSSSSSSSDFEDTLISYIESYHYNKQLNWMNITQSSTNKSNHKCCCTLAMQLRKYDFSNAVAILIPSIPGYHKPPLIQKQTSTSSKFKKTQSLLLKQRRQLVGYLKVQQAIQNHTEEEESTIDDNNDNNNHNNNSMSSNSSSSSSSSSNNNSKEKKTTTSCISQSIPPIVCQYSSIGSLSKKYLSILESSWRYAKATTMSSSISIAAAAAAKTTKGKTKTMTTTCRNTNSNLQLVYPTYEEIIQSVEGINGGGSVPGRRSNVYKEFLRPLYHKWSSQSSYYYNITNNEGSTTTTTTTVPFIFRQKGKNVPHLKTYYQLSNTDKHSMKWFILTSHNLSKAAWGELQNGKWGETFKVFHWELGVFLSPKLLRVKRLKPWLSNKSSNDDDNVATIPLPYNLHPDSYKNNDKPWTID